MRCFWNEDRKSPAAKPDKANYKACCLTTGEDERGLCLSISDAAWEVSGKERSRETERHTRGNSVGS